MPDRTEPAPANRVRELRLMLGIQQSDFARRVKLTRRGLDNVEQRRNKPSLEVARRIADEFGCRVEVAFPPEPQESPQAIAA